MDQIADFFSNLLGMDYWPARWHCGIWTPFHGWLYILSSFMIAAAYITIPFVLFQFVRKREDLPFVRIFWLFIAFILACSATHFIDGLIFWTPVYRLSALILFCTAIISWMAVFGIWRILHDALALKSPMQLESIISMRTKELAETNLRLKKINSDMDNYVYAASHDLKSPINNMEGLLNLILDEAIAGQVPETDLIEKVQSCVLRVQRTIENLTDVVKIQKNPYDDKETLPIESIVQEIMVENEGLFLKNKVDIHLDLSLPELYYSASGLKSILYNLITNAAKYAKKEGQADIWIRTYKHNEAFVLEVEDNGIGIDLNRHGEKLFGLFKRFNTDVEGSGIGLYFTRQLVEKMGGEIEVESSPGKGSLFRVVFNPQNITNQ